VVHDKVGKYYIKIKNAARFIVILLDKLDPWIWRPPSSLKRGGGGTPEAARKWGSSALKDEFRVLDITSAIAVGLAEDEVHSSAEEMDEWDSVKADCKWLEAESDVLAKPRIRKPPIENPRLQQMIDSYLIAEGQHSGRIPVNGHFHLIIWTTRDYYISMIVSFALIRSNKLDRSIL